jgi:tripartite-type tricarboxylate transporter receptor subunit TctC
MKVLGVAAALAVLSLPTWVWAQSGAGASAWPGKPVRVVVPFAPGGTSDVQGRLIGKRLHETTGQPFVIENRPGAAGMIGAELVARAPGDGYTLMFMSAALSVNATLYASRARFDVQKDLAPITLVSSAPMLLLTHPSVPVKSLQDLIALSKRSAGGLNGGHNGAGTTSHIALEMLKQQAGVRAASIAYKGGGPTLAAVVAGEVDFTFATLTTSKQQIEAGRLRPLAVTVAKPIAAYPTLPTMKSLYPEFESDNWFGYFAPGRTPRELLTRMHGVLADAAKSPDVRNFIAREGGVPIGSTPEEFERHFRAEVARYAKVIKAGNIKAD